MLSTEKDLLVKFGSNDGDKEQEIDFPVIIRTRSFKCHHSNAKNDMLRRNTPLTPKFRKIDARLVSKRGRVRVYFKKIPQKSIQYAKDLWNTLVEMQWRWLTLIVTVVNVLAYVVCSLLFYIDSWVSGDFEEENDHHLCMQGIHNLKNFFMLGIETITTTGYGYVHPTEYCQLYFVVLTFSTLTSILIDGAFISVVYAKLNRPKERDIYGQLLSKKAVIALRKGQLCLMVRVNDRDGKHWIDTDIRMYLVQNTIVQKEVVPNHITELPIKPFGMLFWPVDIIHEIGPDSPLWNVSAKDLMTTRLELIVVVSGSSVKTGQLTKNQTSYLNNEIMWGYQFSPCLSYNSTKTEYQVNKKLFHQTVPQEVPLCSARMLYDLQNQVHNNRQTLDVNMFNQMLYQEENVLALNEPFK